MCLSFVSQLAEYRQRKALSDGQKKQKKKKKKAETEEQRRDDDQTVEEQRGDQTTVFSLSKTLRSGETVTHDQTYTIEVRTHNLLNSFETGLHVNKVLLTVSAS